MALNMEFVEKMPVSQKLIILVGVILVLGGLWYYMMYEPLQTELTQKEEEFDKENEALKELKRRKEDLNNMKSRIEELEDELKEMRRALPKDAEIGQILLTFDNLGKKNGIEFSRITPKGQSAVGNLYRKVPIDLDFTGNYRWVMRFFYEVVNIRRIVKVTDIKMKGGKRGGGSRINVSCQATTYISY